MPAISNISNDYISRSQDALLDVMDIFANKPNKRSFTHLNKTSTIYLKWAENIHLQPWEEVQDALIRLKFVFDLFDVLILRIENDHTSASIAVHNYYTALKTLQEAMEDHVLGGMMVEEAEGDFISVEETIKLLND